MVWYYDMSVDNKNIKKSYDDVHKVFKPFTQKNQIVLKFMYTNFES